MDAMVALISPNFINNKWCDQEVGFAIGRQIPIIPVKLDQDPYGFIGKYQALQDKGKNSLIIAKEISALLITKSNIGPKLTNSLINRFKLSQSWEESKRLIEYIEKSKYVTKENLKEMRYALNENSQISEAWGVPEIILEIALRKVFYYFNHMKI